MGLKVKNISKIDAENTARKKILLRQINFLLRKHIVDQAASLVNYGGLSHCALLFDLLIFPGLII